MPRFFVDASQIAGDRATLTSADAGHLARSLRARAGETIIVVEDGSIEHGVRLDEVSLARVSGVILWSRAASGEPRLAVHVLQAVPAQGMDTTVEALSAAGAASIRPVLTNRTVARPDASRASRRLERWALIAREAAQLAGRAVPPEVHRLATLPGALDALPPGAHIVVCDTRTGAVPIRDAVPHPPADLGLVIGPEGGFDEADLEILARAGAVSVHLGPRTWPSRLAGTVATVLLLAGAGDLDAAAEALP
ncbi:MAG: RsmE family RNA methyltransferase [Candidatus Dormiibacterota bacterium]